MSTAGDDVWAAGDAYEPYVGRWSRLIAQRFLAWLDMPPGKEWLDVGCGTGALTQTILEHAVPRTVTGVDASPGFIEYAQAHITDARASFRIGHAEALPVDTASCDAAVSGLVLNFLPQPALGVADMARTVRPGAVVAAYLWDYAGGMEMIRQFWDAAVALDPAACDRDEGRRFPLCRPEALAALFAGAGLHQVDVRAIDVPTHFRDFDDYWSPFLGGQGPAPGYVMSLGEEHRAALSERLRSQLPRSPDGSIRLTARAWAVRGYTP